jgi:hypothetical protein
LKATPDQRLVDSFELIVEVTLPNVELGFFGRAMELSQDGRYLVVWGPAPGQEGRHPAHTGADDVAVVDIRERKIIARKSLPHGIRCATIDQNHVYISSNSGNLFHRLSHSLEESQRMFTQTAPLQLIRVGNDRLIAVSEQPQIFDIVLMKPVSNEEIGGHQGQQSIRALNRGQVQIGNRVINQQSGQTVRTIGFANLPFIVTAQIQGNHFAIDHSSQVTAWGRRLAGNSLVTTAGSNIVSWPGHRFGTLSDRWPILVSTSKSQQPATTTTVLEIADLIDGTVAHTSTIDVCPTTNNSPHLDYNTQNRLIVHEEQIVYLDRQRILLATIPIKTAEALPVPVHFSPAKIEIIDAEKPALIKPAVVGNTKEITFNLMSEFEGLKIDSGTGELTIDTPLLWAQYVKQFSHPSRMFDQMVRHGGTNESPLDSSQNAKQYKLLSGKDLPAGRIAVQIPVSLSLQCDDGQRDTTQFGVIVVGPRQPIEAALAAKNAEQEKLQAAARESQQKMAEEQAKLRATQSNAPPATGVTERLEALETRLRRLEAAIDSILKRLDENKK